MNQNYQNNENTPIDITDSPMKQRQHPPVLVAVLPLKRPDRPTL
jgi:hypothetical protein